MGIMEEQKKIKVTFGKAQKITHPILGNPVQGDNGTYVIKTPATIGKVYTIVCPSCQKVILVKAPSAKRYKVSCKDCGTSISFKGREPLQNLDNDSTQNPQNRETDDEKCLPTQKFHDPNVKPNAKLVWGGLFNNKSYDIGRLGEHYIGREDNDIKSDVSVKDEFASRRSLLLEVISKGGRECLYKLTIKKASNPVLVNGLEKEIGESIYLNYGDTILIGNTTLTFKKKS